MPLIGAVADDLTGATTTGVLLARSKARTAVFLMKRRQKRQRDLVSWTPYSSAATAGRFLRRKPMRRLLQRQMR